jgi:hypothetical protein
MRAMLGGLLSASLVIALAGSSDAAGKRTKQRRQDSYY